MRSLAIFACRDENVTDLRSASMFRIPPGGGPNTLTSLLCLVWRNQKKYMYRGEETPLLQKTIPDGWITVTSSLYLAQQICAFSTALEEL